ncbi:hypothetical protein PYW08_003169 [Mythimna loreyi]|uniref:Uncharacterized protein n=1 Tax=Mythimna loreyi TaxID=667449 RepID=A0ACC2QT01_9NEOP|nr:hypothetical protein PYW08_003169 [Mythimna loreyi]
MVGGHLRGSSRPEKRKDCVRSFQPLLKERTTRGHREVFPATPQREDYERTPRGLSSHSSKRGLTAMVTANLALGCDKSCMRINACLRKRGKLGGRHKLPYVRVCACNDAARCCNVRRTP